MVDVHTILYRIAEDLRQYKGLDHDAAIEEFILGCSFNIHLAITTDVEESELDFLERYGRGHTFYFKLKDYEHGKLLAGQVYWIFLGLKPDMAAYTGDRFTPDDRLYLFVHVCDIEPAAIVKMPDVESL